MNENRVSVCNRDTGSIRIDYFALACHLARKQAQIIEEAERMELIEATEYKYGRRGE